MEERKKEIVRVAEYSLLTKLRQQHILNKKTRWMIQVSLLNIKLQLNNIYNNMNEVKLLINIHT